MKMDGWYIEIDGKHVAVSMKQVEAYGKRKIIKQTTVGDAWISTVWLGLDHNFGDGLPQIYETMIFTENNGTHDHYQRRYSWWRTAQHHHDELVDNFIAFNEGQITYKELEECLCY